MIGFVATCLLIGLGALTLLSIATAGLFLWIDRWFTRRRETVATIRRAAQINLRRQRNCRLDRLWGRYGVTFEGEFRDDEAVAALSRDLARQDETGRPGETS